MKTKNDAGKRRLDNGPEHRRHGDTEDSACTGSVNLA
jgi:hypothetical protein